MGKIINEIGKTYGYLTVMARAENTKDKRAQWLCKCKCGNEVIVSGKNLRSGNTQSCGCYHIEKLRENRKQLHQDMIGKTYDYLTVLDYGDYAIRPDGRHDQMMVCKCNLCGTITQVRTYDLKLGNQISCGCINSKGNTFIKLYLQNHSYNFKSEYQISECKDQKPLPFDFALLKEEQLIGLIEYQGIQHFTYQNHGWENKEKFEIIQKHDKIKFDYCKENNIKLYYITYKDNIEQKLQEILNELYSE